MISDNQFSVAIDHPRLDLFKILTASLLRFYTSFQEIIRKEPSGKWDKSTADKVHPFEQIIEFAFTEAKVTTAEREKWFIEIKRGFFQSNFNALPLKEMNGEFPSVLVDGRSYLGVLRNLTQSQSLLVKEIFEQRELFEQQNFKIDQQSIKIDLQNAQIVQLENRMEEVQQRSTAIEKRLMQFEQFMVTHVSRSETMLSHLVNNSCSAQLSNRRTLPGIPTLPEYVISPAHSQTSASYDTATSNGNQSHPIQHSSEIPKKYPVTFTTIHAKWISMNLALTAFNMFHETRAEEVYKKHVETCKTNKTSVGKFSSTMCAMRKMVKKMFHVAREVTPAAPSHNVGLEWTHYLCIVEKIAKKAVNIVALESEVGIDKVTKTMMKGYVVDKDVNCHVGKKTKIDFSS